jgi:hypothetical protein
MAGQTDDSKFAGRASSKAGRTKKLRVILIVLGRLLIVSPTIWIMVRLGMAVKRTAETYESLLAASDTSQDANVVLPAHASNDFITVIPVSGAQRLCVWRDSNGKDRLAAQTMDFGMSMKQRVVLFDQKFSKTATFRYNQGGMSGMSGGFAVGDIDGDGSPEVFMSGSDAFSKSNIVGFRGTGEQFLKASFKMNMAPQIYLVNPPGSQTGIELLVFDNFAGWNEPKFHVLSLPNGAREPADEQFFETGALTGPGVADKPVFCDWDDDGVLDVIFFGEGSEAYILEEGSKEYSRIVPFVKGAFLRYMDFELSQHGTGARAVERYTSSDGDKVSVLALYNAYMEMPDFLGKESGDKAESEDKSDILEWIAQDSSGVVSKQRKTFKGSGMSGESNLSVTDITGDGVPEICALVEQSKLVIYDILGKELYSKVLIGNRELRSLGADWLVAGDFDGDMSTDLAFIYEDGLFIPKLDTLRAKP